MSRRHDKKRFSFTSFTVFVLMFFVVTTLLTSLILLPRLNKLLEDQHLQDSRLAMNIETELFKRFIETHLHTLKDVANSPLIISAALLSDKNNHNVADILDAISIPDGSASSILVNINGDIIYNSHDANFDEHDLQGEWFDGVLDGTIAYDLKLLPQSNNKAISFIISVPTLYNGAAEGILSSKITVPLTRIFTQKTADAHGTFKIHQNGLSISMHSPPLNAISEITSDPLQSGITLSYIVDGTDLLEEKASLRNQLLAVLFSGLFISFLIITVVGFRTLQNSHDRTYTHKNVKTRKYLIPLIICFIGITASLSAFFYVLYTQKQDERQTMQARHDNYFTAIERDISFKIKALSSLKAFYDSSENVSREEFKSFTIPLINDNESIQALEWVPMVKGSERAALIKRARSEGFTHFDIRERSADGVMQPAPIRDKHFPVLYAEPYEKNKMIIGYDAPFNSVRNMAIQRAIKTGLPIASSPISLIQETEKQAGLLIFSPIYKKGASINTSADRQRNVKGLTLLVLRVGHAVKHALNDTEYDIHLLIEDVTNPNATSILYKSVHKDYKKTDLISQYHLSIAGREWRISISPRVSQDPATTYWSPLFVLLGGLGFNFFITYTLIQLVRRKDIVDSLVQTRTSQIKDAKQFQDLIMSNIPDLLFVKDSEFRIVEANPAFLSVYPEDMRDSVIGTTTVEKYDPAEAEIFLQDDRRALKEGHVETEETVVFPDGQTRTLYTKKTRFTDSQGQHFILGIAHDISNIKAAEKALKASEERYEIAVRGSAVGLWDWNIKNDTLFWSDRFKDIIGISNTHYIPTCASHMRRIHPDDRLMVKRTLIAHLKHQKPFDIEHRFQHENGHYVTVHMRGQAIWDDDQNATRMAGSIDDITQKKHAEEELLRTNMELERFAYVASHDLQEPLRMVTNFTGLLEKRYGDKLDDDAKQYIDFAYNGAKRMQMLVNDLLEYARSGQNSQDYKAIDLNKIVASALDTLKISIEERNATITYDTLPTALGNPVPIASLIQNIMSNALKYQDPEKKAVITISATEKGAMHEISITDNGIGMKPEYCKQIFEPFKRLHAKNEYAGTGMGLAICRKIVENLGGTIFATSDIGKGTTFTFTLPRYTQEQDAGTDYDRA